LHRLNMIVTDHPLPVLGALLSPQRFGFLYADHKRVPLHLIVGADYFPTRSKAQQFFKRFFRCHFCGPLYHLCATYIPLKLSRNLKIPFFLSFKIDQACWVRGWTAFSKDEL